MNKDKRLSSCFLNYQNSLKKGYVYCCPKAWLMWSVFGVIVLFDRLSKLWAMRSCLDSVFITSWLQCDLVVNRGVSFGIFHTDNSWIFGAVTLFVMLLTVAVVSHAVMRVRSGKSYLGELCIIVGSLSNILDRFIYDGVIDFIVVKTPWGFWPAYNVADALIVCGVALLIITNYRES